MGQDCPELSVCKEMIKNGAMTDGVYARMNLSVREKMETD